MRGIEQIPWMYDVSMALMPGIRRWRRALLQSARGRVLEVGCGTGLMLNLYPDEPQPVIGLEPDRAALRRAAERRPDGPLCCASVERLPFNDASFDTVVSGLVFCSVNDARRGLAEISRVLKSDGRLLMLEHVHARSAAGRWLLDRMQPGWTLITGGCHPNRDTEFLVERAGFRIERAHYRARGLLRRFVARKADVPAAS